MLAPWDERGIRSSPSSGVIWVSGMFGDSDCGSHFVFLFGGGTSLINGSSAECWSGPVENVLLWDWGLSVPFSASGRCWELRFS